MDTLNRSALRAFEAGASEHPHLDQFAAQAVRFTNAYSTASWTLPAHRSLLTGLYPDRYARAAHAGRLRTLARTLRENGFETVAFTDEGFLDHKFGLSDGFDRYDGTLDSTPSSDVILPRQGSPNRPRGANLFDRAIALLSKRAADAPPLFLFLHSFAVHDYFIQNSWALEFLGVKRHRNVRYLDCLHGADCGDEAWNRMKALYAAEIASFDAGFGKLLEAVESSGQQDRTALFLVSDHGEGFDPAAGRIHHAGRLHEDLIRIPIVVGGPGIKPRACPDPISLVDIAPTIIELLGLQAPTRLDGESFAQSLYTDVRGRLRTLYAMEYSYQWEAGKRRPVRSRGRFDGLGKLLKAPAMIAVIRGRYWFIRGPGDNEEVYDMETDPRQTKNQLAHIAGSHLLAELRAAASKRGGVSEDPETIPNDPELSKELKSLGYVH